MSSVLAERAVVVRGSTDLSALESRLTRLLDPLLGGDIYVPEQKALLSRDGGVCADDGSRLLFDPLSPQEHTCPRCGRVFSGDRHHRAWIWRYHIWLSERAIHLALLGGISREGRFLDCAQSIVERYARTYRKYPNANNVLGPTRLFFSTYLESIWLTQLIGAALLLRTADPGRAKQLASINKMVSESANLISSFDEVWSNRQVWNNTALIAAGMWLDGIAFPNDPSAEDHTDTSRHKYFLHGLDGPHGIRAMLVRGVTSDGLWYEGENYHFFALRGFLLAAELARSAGVDLYGIEGPHQRISDMFVSPLRTLLPDLTVPARGDSPFGVSILQPRFAELWEIGWARTGDRRLESLLATMYSADVPEGEDFGLAEIAEQEQNKPPTKLDRDKLGWKSLLFAKTDRPRASGGGWQAGSTLLSDAGVAVFRSGTERYVSVECGGHAGGHGHPDLLHLTAFVDEPLFMDFGTASYVSPSLHWYRSTLAHNAPGLTGLGQKSRKGWCAAFDLKGEWGWCRAAAEDLFGVGTSAVRTIVLGPKYVLDIVDVDVDSKTSVDLPVHILDSSWCGHEGWRRFAGHKKAMDNSLGDVLELTRRSDLVLKGDWQTSIFVARDSERLLVAKRPGPPDDQFADGNEMAFLIRRATGPGRWLQCYAFGEDRPKAVSVANQSIQISFENGAADVVTLKDDRCRIKGRAGVVTKLAGSRLKPEPRWEPKRRPTVVHCPLIETPPDVGDWESVLPAWSIATLSSKHYRRSEYPYRSRGEFAARIAMFALDTRIYYAVRVIKRDMKFRRETDPSPELDNETPDIHSDGLQIYLGAGTSDWRGFLLVPDPDSNRVRVNAVGGIDVDVSMVDACWKLGPDGYAVLASVDTGTKIERGSRFLVNVVVNEMYSNRQRRAGQLALSGGGWVYLRGDRESPATALIAEVS